ncbi:MAG: DUF3320 domain-containing protein [Mesorhizobium sp.]|nr:MAG: DUF3320 domain-containing protein [Mesorhizobium sp.]
MNGASTPDRSYAEARVQRPAGQFELHETPTGLLAGLVEQVVAAETPIHLDEVVSRIRDAWGLQRAGGRTRRSPAPLRTDHCDTKTGC